MYTFKFADIGEGIHEGKVTEILVKVGDSVKDGTDLFVVETDKITTEVSSPVNGVIKQILVKVGDTVHVGQDMFEIDDNASSSSTAAASTSSSTSLHASVAAATTPAKEEGGESGASVVGEVKVSNNVLPLFGQNKQAASSISATTTVRNENYLASPLARNVAKENGIDLATITPSDGVRITLVDVQAALARKQSSGISHVQAARSEVAISAPKQELSVAKPLALAEGDIKHEMTPMRKAIANAMRRSWTNVAYTNLSLEIDITEVFEQRNKIKDYVYEVENLKLNVLPFIIKALAKTLKLFPVFNALNDEATGTLVIKKAINIGIAVDTKDGLIVPNIKNADQLSIIDIAKKISEIATKARNKKITLPDITNGTFTVSNYGSLGINIGTPVINYPEIAIAGLGSFNTKLKKVGINVVEAKTMFLTIAADHRWVDGGDIARFANQVKHFLENISLLFI